MPHTLTLSQVRASLHFAWHPQGFLLVDGKLFRAVLKEPPASEGYREALHVSLSSLGDDDRMLNIGWHHAADCSCDLCNHRRLSLVSSPEA
jgi:hypothetical protein